MQDRVRRLITRAGVHGESVLAGLLFLAALTLFFLQAASLLAPIVHEQHNWRQADVFSVAYSFHLDGWDFLRPRVDFWRGPTGIVGMEAPVYPSLVHFAMYLFGDHPRVARIVSGLCFWGAMSLAAWVISPRDVEPSQRRIRAVAFLAAGFFSPMGLGEFRQIQPDGTAVSLTLAAAALCLLYSRTARPKWLILGVILYTLAAITKPPVLVAGPALWLLSFAEQRFRIRRMVICGLPFLLPLAAYFVWFRWAGQVTKEYEALPQYFNTSFDFKEVAGNLQNFGLYRHVFGFLIGSYTINWVLFPAALAGVVLAFRQEERRIGAAMFAWFVLAAFFTLSFAFRTTVHWYYAMIVFPPAAYFTGLGLSSVLLLGKKPTTTVPLFRISALFIMLSLLCIHWAAGGAELGAKVPSADGPAFEKTWFHGAGILILVGLLLISTPAGIFAKPGWIEHWRASVYVFALAAGFVALPRAAHDAGEAFKFRSGYKEWETFDQKYADVRKVVERHSTRTDLFLVDGYQPFYLHMTRRRGFSSDPGTVAANGGLKYYLSRGAKYYVHFPENQPIELARKDRVMIEGAREIELYCIAPDGCNK
jgi:hypothetical protein